MRRRIWAMALLAGCAASGQTEAPFSFEVASVKQATPGPWRESKTGVDRVDFSRVTLRYCLAFSYGVKEYQISGPSWLGELRYDIVAKGPAGARREQLPSMMNALLTQRFQLQAHAETREFNVFTLSVGKNGPKLKELPPDPNAEAIGAKFGISMTGSGVGKLEARNATMASLANTLSRLLGQPAVDMTALIGRYDLDLEYSPDDSRGMQVAMPAGGPLPVAAQPGASIFESVQQYGLKLEARKVPQKAIVVDHAEKVPSEN